MRASAKKQPMAMLPPVTGQKVTGFFFLTIPPRLG
jgi:hypothetical protein